MTLDGTRTYLVGREAAALVDPGPGGGEAEALWERLASGADVRWVLLTHAHPDHAAGAEAAARRFSAPVAASAACLRRLALEGLALGDGDRIPVRGEGGPLEAVETPGHSGDGLCFHRPSDGVLLTGDLVLGEGSSLVAHPDGSVADYLGSLERLLALSPTLLLPGHGPDVPDARERLREYRAHRLEREEQVLAAVRGGAASVPEIRRRVYGELPGGLARAAEANVAAHLAHLRDRGFDVPEPPEGSALGHA